MANYWFSFGAPAAASLAPTFITFTNAAGVTSAAPAITERPPGSGLYNVSYGATASMAFALDGATTGLGTTARYIYGCFDPQDNMSATLTVIGASLAVMGASLSVMGTTLSAAAGQVGGIGTTLSFINGNVTSYGTSLFGSIGDPSSSFGSTATDPTTLFGFVKRAQEFWEGNQTYYKATGLLDFYNRGSSTLLREKTVSDSSSTTTKT